MAVTAFWYGNGLKSITEAKVNWPTDTIKVSLHTSAYTPNQDTHDFFDDVSATQVAATGGYTAGGATLGTKTNAYTAGTNTVALDAADTVWAASTITARYAVIYDSTPGTDATRPLLGYVDFGADVTSTAGDFTITWAAGGILTLAAA
jgi:hypothetical protein